MNKQFTVVGTSVLNCVHKVRFANDLASRMKFLKRNGHTAISLTECPAADKVGAVKFALTVGEGFPPEDVALFEAYLKANAF